MGKLRTAVDVVAFAAAIIGFSAAYYQYELVKEARKISENTQKELLALPESGTVNVTNINSAITNLGKISGNTTWQIEPNDPETSGSSAEYALCYPSDSPDLTVKKPAPITAAPSTENMAEEATPAPIDVRYSNGELQVELVSLRINKGGRSLTVTTEIRNISDDAFYIGNLNDNNARFAASSSGQRLALDHISGLAYDESTVTDNAIIAPGQSLTASWYVISRSGSFEPGNLSLRGTFVVRTALKKNNVQVQLKNIRIE